jgi:hypothetical protein
LIRQAKWKVCLLVAGYWACLASSCLPVLSAQDEVSQRFGEIVTSGRYVLRWGMQTGQKFTVVAVQETVTEIEGPLGKSGKMPAALTVHQEWEVLDSDDNSLTLVQTFRQLQMETVIPSVGKIIVDTQAPEPESLIAKQMQANLSELIGRQLKLHMNRLGQVDKFEFVELPASETPATSQFLTKENLKNAVGQMVQFPKTTRAVGETWGTTAKAPQPNGTAEVNTEYTILEVTPDQPRQLKIGVAPKLTLKVKDDQVTVQNQQSAGHIIYDDNLALVRETYLKQSFTFVIKGEEGGTRTIESTMRMKIDPIAASEPSESNTPVDTTSSGSLNLETGKSDN